MPRDTVVWLDWGELLKAGPRACYAKLVDGGSVRACHAELLRVAVARAAALDHGRNPVALFLWLLRHPDADFALRYEDQARRDLAAASARPVATEPTEPQPLGDLLGKYLKETPP